MKLLLKLAVCMGIILICSQTSPAQYLSNLSDNDCVELSLDMIRIGVQQEDTSKVMEVLGANVLVRGVEVKAKYLVTQDFDQIFTNSSMRVKSLNNKSLSATDNRFKDSNLWDFDILAPKISIIGDSAFVDCELVLWGANSGDSNKKGSRITERLVFWSPTNGQPDKVSSNKPLRWQLVECNNMFDFLENYGAKSVQVDKTGGLQ